MSGFTLLKDISTAFRDDLRQISAELFSARVCDNFEDDVLKKLREINLFTSKLKLLRASPLASTAQIAEKDKSNVLNNYEETVVWSIIEQQTVKSVTQAHAVKSLLTAPNESLDPQMSERKREIKEALIKYGELETQLRQLNAVLKEKQNDHMIIQAQWDNELGKMREIKASADSTEEVDTNGPLYQKLRVLVNKIELMRWMMSKLVTSRTGSYDWLADPHGRYAALKLSREVNTVENFVAGHSS